LPKIFFVILRNPKTYFLRDLKEQYLPSSSYVFFVLL
jgi:hypothetical protein